MNSEFRLDGRVIMEESKVGGLSMFRGEFRGEGEELLGDGERDEGGVDGGEGVSDSGGMSEWYESEL